MSALHLLRPFLTRSCSAVARPCVYAGRLPLLARLASTAPSAPKKNEDIGSKLVYYISETGDNEGVQPLRDVLARLDRRNYDLLQVATRPYTADPGAPAATASPPLSLPVCKAVSRKLRYEKAKAKKPEKSAHVVDKEVQIGVSASSHDLAVKVKRVYQFLASGHRVRIVLEHKGSAKFSVRKEDLVNDILLQCQPVTATIVSPATSVGKNVTMTLMGKKTVAVAAPSPESGRFFVVIASRSEEKCAATVEQLGHDDASKARLAHLAVDLQSLPSIDRFVAEYDRLGRKCDVLINNAGAMFSNRETVGHKGHTIDKTLWLNHLGTMYLTIKLLPFMSDAARIVVVSSGLHPRGVADPQLLTNPDLMPEYDGMKMYSTSKLFNIWFTRQLQSVYLPSSPYSKVTAVIMNPGFVPQTGLKRTSRPLVKLLMNYIIPWMPFTTTAQDSAERLWYCATQPDIGGQYIDRAECVAIPGSEESNDMSKVLLALFPNLWQGN
ncbi:hypothetical protein RI367_002994 [Sorochytrium milnesiophthora]